jgi:hypothetical protein
MDACICYDTMMECMASYGLWEFFGNVLDVMRKLYDDVFLMVMTNFAAMFWRRSCGDILTAVFFA